MGLKISPIFVISITGVFPTTIKYKIMKVYIGEFTEQDLRQGNDKKAIAEAQERDENKRNGIKYIEAKHDKKKNVMKVWLTDNF